MARHQHQTYVGTNEGSFDLFGQCAATEDVDFLAPIVAGARARGIADAFEISGLAAILVDRHGGVLYLGPSAERFLHGSLRLAGNHLVADSAGGNRHLAQLIAAAVAGEPGEMSISMPERRELRVRALPIPEAADDPVQLMKAVLIIEDRELPL